MKLDGNYSSFVKYYMLDELRNSLSTTLTAFLTSHFLEGGCVLHKGHKRIHEVKSE